MEDKLPSMSDKNQHMSIYSVTLKVQVPIIPVVLWILYILSLQLFETINRVDLI